MTRLVGAIALPDGTWVRGRGRREPPPGGTAPEYGLYLGVAPDARRLLGRRAWRPQWPADWLDWPDFRAPRDPDAARAAIVHVFQRARTGERVEVACRGGTGRTGTVIACLAVLAGHPPAHAVHWTRTHYRPRAVETRAQRRFVTWFATRLS